MLTLERQGRGGEGALARRQMVQMQQIYQGELMEEAKAIWLASRSHIYQWGDKSSKLLHRLCEQATLPAHIPCVRSPDGEVLMDPSLIAGSFADYY